jgi:hypothetical protein
MEQRRSVVIEVGSLVEHLREHGTPSSSHTHTYHSQNFVHNSLSAISSVDLVIPSPVGPLSMLYVLLMTYGVVQAD